MTWWGWMIIGALLLGAELFAIDAQFYLVFMGIAATLVGAANLLGLTLPEWAQWVAFAILSVGFMFTFRKSLYEKIRGGAVGFRETLSGHTLDVTESLAPGADARMEFRGSKWTVRNVGATEIASGTRATIVKVDGLTLNVTAD